MTRAVLVCLAAVLAAVLSAAGCTGADDRGDGIAVSVERTQLLGPPFEEDEIARLRVREDGLLDRDR
jgi:hypothetical protein